MRPLQSGAGEAGALLPEVAGDPPRALLASYSSGIDYLPCGVKAKVRFSRMSCLLSTQRISHVVLIATNVRSALRPAIQLSIPTTIETRWRIRDSNPRPQACKARALPAELIPR